MQVRAVAHLPEPILPCGIRAYPEHDRTFRTDCCIQRSNVHDGVHQVITAAPGCVPSSAKLSGSILMVPIPVSTRRVAQRPRPLIHIAQVHEDLQDKPVLQDHDATVENCVAASEWRNGATR